MTRENTNAEKPVPCVLAIGAHPDDIEFMMAGTLILLKQAGWELHCMHLADGRCGTAGVGVDEIVATRRREAINACELIGAHYHECIAADLKLMFTAENVAKVVSVVRRTHPRILLTHSPADYMEDHTNACRIAVTAAFARGMLNHPCDPPLDPVEDDITVYHSLPHGLRDPLRRRIRAGQYVDVTSVLRNKREMLAAHRSQKEWLDRSQGMNAYLDSMEATAHEVGKMSGCFECAEGWRRRLHLGFSATDSDPLSESLGKKCRVDEEYESELSTL